MFYHLPKENNASETPNGTVKDKSKTTNEATLKKFEKDNKMFKGYLLRHMTNPLLDLFVTFKYVKIIWERPKVKYGADDARKNKYVIGEWLQFQIIDDKPIIEEVHIYKNTCAEVLNENMKICEILQANMLIERFPPSWSDYWNQLKYKKKDLTL